MDLEDGRVGVERTFQCNDGVAEFSRLIHGDGEAVVQRDEPALVEIDVVFDVFCCIQRSVNWLPSLAKFSPDRQS